MALVFDIRMESLLSLQESEKTGIRDWVDKLKILILDHNLDALKECLTKLEGSCKSEKLIWMQTGAQGHAAVPTWAHYVVWELILWFLDRMFFDAKNSDNVAFMIVLESPLAAVPRNFLHVIIGYESFHLVQYFMQRFLPLRGDKESININEVDHCSSIDRCFREVPLRGQTALTLCILNQKSHRISCMKRTHNAKIPLELIVENSYAGKTESEFIFDWLVNNPDVDLNQENAMGWTPLCLAIKQRLWYVVDVLMKKGCDTARSSHVFGKDLYPWFLAGEEGNLLLMQKLKAAHCMVESVLGCVDRDMGQLIMSFVMNNDYENLKLLWDVHKENQTWHVNMNFRNQQGQSFFHIAFVNSNIDVFYLLVEWNVSLYDDSDNASFLFDPLEGDLNGNTMLHWLAMKLNAMCTSQGFVRWNFSDVLKRIFDFHLLRLMKQSMFAIEHDDLVKYFMDIETCGHSQYVEFFMDDVKKFANALNAEGETCLHVLAQCEGFRKINDMMKLDIHSGVFKSLIEVYHADFNLCIQQSFRHRYALDFARDIHLSAYENKYCKSVLMLAIQNQNTVLYRYILETHGEALDISKKDYYGNTLLHIAFYSGSYLFSQDKGVTVAFHAEAKTLQEAQRYLFGTILDLAERRRMHCDDDACILNVQNSEKQSVLHLIGKYSNSIDFDLFARYCPRVDVQDSDGNTPLMLALKHGKYDKKLLAFLSWQHPLCLTDVMNRNIFHVLADKLFGDESLNLFDSLLENQDSKTISTVLNAKDLDGNSPLFYGVKRNNKRLCLEFLEFGARWYGQNILRQDVFHFGNQDLKQFLFQHYIWQAKMRIFEEGVACHPNNMSLVRWLDADIIRIIYAFGTCGI